MPLFLVLPHCYPETSQMRGCTVARLPGYCWSSWGNRLFYPTQFAPHDQTDQYRPHHFPAKPGLAESYSPRDHSHRIRKAPQKTRHCQTLGSVAARKWNESAALACDPSSTSSVQRGELSIPGLRSVPTSRMKIAWATARARLSILNPHANLRRRKLREATRTPEDPTQWVLTEMRGPAARRVWALHHPHHLKSPSSISILPPGRYRTELAS